MKSAQRFIKEVIPRTPLIVGTVVQHYKNGPPAPSWDLKFHLFINVIKDFIARGKTSTIEEVQAMNNYPVPLPDFVISTPVVVPSSYRIRAGNLLEPLFAPYDDLLGWDWRHGEEGEDTPQITGEWLDLDEGMERAHEEKAAHGGKTIKNIGGKGRGEDGKWETVVLYLHGGAYYLCSAMTHRFITWRISKYGKARTFAINYRLAPQHPFPAAVEDALAAYLYLLEPPADAGFRPVDPKHIVIAGDSAGGGLTMATLLAIRDARLPLPAGGVGISPWVDLTHSLPSILSNVATDYLPEDGFEHLPSSALDFDRLPKKQRDAETEAAAVVTVTDAETPQLKRMQYYAPNQVLKVPYASPIFDLKGFTGLPPLLLQTGACERLRDEAIYTGHKASLHYPSAPSLTTLPPTQVTLEVYADMPHVFQMFVSTPQAATSFSRIGEFVQHVVAPSENRPIFERFDVDTKGNAVKSPIRVMEKEEWNLWESRLALSLSEKVKEAEKAGMIVKGVPSSVGEEAGMKQKNKL